MRLTRAAGGGVRQSTVNPTLTTRPSAYTTVSLCDGNGSDVAVACLGLVGFGLLRQGGEEVAHDIGSECDGYLEVRVENVGLGEREKGQSWR